MKNTKISIKNVSGDNLCEKSHSGQQIAVVCRRARQPGG